jgi:hypothetical protein
MSRRENLLFIMFLPFSRLFFPPLFRFSVTAFSIAFAAGHPATQNGRVQQPFDPV